VYQAYCVVCGRKLRTFLTRELATARAQKHADTKGHQCAVVRLVTPAYFDLQIMRDMKALPESIR
jgi:hypothetical protein